MQILRLLALGSAAVASASTVEPGNPSGAFCAKFKSRYSNNTFLVGDLGYKDESEGTWSSRSWLEPQCIFAPTDAEQLSYAVRSLAQMGVSFAVRGGGHMPIVTANGIGASGVLISCTNLDVLALSSDKKTLSVGPGRIWTDVYNLLDGTGRAVVGARIGPVGVPGFLLGGGVSFYSYEHGLGSTNGNIRAYQCVLADGCVVEVTASNKYADLYWALQGGGNSFCLVTRFDLQTHTSPVVMLGSATYGSSEVKDTFMDSVFKFATSGHVDPRAAIIPVARFDAGSPGPIYSSTLFYNGNETSPTVLKDFLGDVLKPENGINQLSPVPLGQYSNAVAGAFEQGGESYGKRQRFHLLPIVADRKAMQVVHDAYFGLAQTTFAGMEATIGLAFNPITSQLLSASNRKPGSLQGLDETPSFWVEETYSWTDQENDAQIDDFIQTFHANISASLQSLNATGSFYYLNEADENQPVFEHYPAGNLELLKEIRNKYDPGRVYTDLMLGGFKVD